MGSQGYLGIAVVEVGGQEAVGEVAFDEAGRCQLLWQAERGGGQRRTGRLSDQPRPNGASDESGPAPLPQKRLPEIQPPALPRLDPGGQT